MAIFAIRKSLRNSDTFSERYVWCLQLYGRHKEYLSGLVGSEFETVSLSVLAGTGAQLPVEAVDLGNLAAVCTSISRDCFILGRVGSFYLVAPNRK